MKMIRAVGLLAVALAAGAVSAQTLKPGMPAPKLDVSGWVKGEPVTNLSRGTYVVEFWATWCGPCRESIPHITELAKKYEGKVTFVGVSIWEDGDDIPGQVSRFVRQMGDRMDYRVALDNGSAMATTWMEAAMQPGIPSAFIVKDGKVMWIGHPMNMDEKLAQVVDGSFDLEASIAEFDQQIAAENARKELEERLSAIRLKANTDRAGALEDLAKIEVGDDMMTRMMVNETKLEILMGGPKDEFMAAVRSMVAKPEDRQLVAQFAYQLANEPYKNKPLSLEVVAEIEKAEGEKDVIVLYYLMEVYAANEKWSEAVARGEKALEIVSAPDSPYGGPEGDFAKMLKQSIAEYKAKQ